LNLNKVKLQVFGYDNRTICSIKNTVLLEGTLKEELFRLGKYYDIYIAGLLGNTRKFKGINNTCIGRPVKWSVFYLLFNKLGLYLKIIELFRQLFFLIVLTGRLI